MYSANEIKMFNSLGIFKHLTSWTDIEPSVMYRLSVEHCFLNNQVGNDVEALRRGAKVFCYGDLPYRMTEEFDKIIEF